MESKILVLDIETTGFDHRRDCILELGMVELDLTTGEVKELFDERFKEAHLSARHHNAWIFANGFMDHDDVRGALSLNNYKGEIQQILDRYRNRITAWNRPFDIDFLKSRGFDFGKDIPDPMRESTKYFRLTKRNGSCCKWPTAQEAWDKLFPEIVKIEKHRGLDDAVMEARIIYQLVNRGVYLV